MFTTLFSVALLLAIAKAVVAQSPFSIDTPSLVQCQPAQITWSDTGNSPYDLLVVSAQDVCGDALEDLGNQTSIAMTWTVNIAAGTQVVLSLIDSVGSEAWSGSITIGSSNDTSCLPSSSAYTSASGATLTVPAGNAATPTTSSHPSSSAFAPAGAANAGLGPTSGALSTRYLSVATLVGCTVLTFLAFAL